LGSGVAGSKASSAEKRGERGGAHRPDQVAGETGFLQRRELGAHRWRDQHDPPRDRCGEARQHFALRRARRVVDQHRAPRPLRQQGGSDLIVGHDGRSRAPALQPPCDQRRLDCRRGDDQHVVAGKVGHRQARLVGIAEARKRNADAEGSARSGNALDRDRAAHALDDPLGNGQAQAGAAVFSCRAAVGLLELRKNPCLVVGRNADAGVAF
jgi:hypothetical protein